MSLARMSKLGVSIWLDMLSRDMITSGELRELIKRNVVGMTSNPTIFARALSGGEAYSQQLADLAGQGASPAEAIFHITTDDVRAACDVFKSVYIGTNGQDGRVSIEVQPGYAYDTAATIVEAQELWDQVDRENVMIKIPATLEGLPAITAATAAGISVNVTLIFSMERYCQVGQAYLDGLEKAREAGRDLSNIRSAASVFLSRIDTKVDSALHELGTPEALALQGTVAIANARLCYQAYEEIFGEPFTELRAAGAHAQRPLWASTGTKNPEYSDTMYVDNLIAPDVINTMPPATLEAVDANPLSADNTISGTYEKAESTLAELDSLGVDLSEIMAELESEGVDSFVSSWEELTQIVRSGLQGQ